MIDFPAFVQGLFLVLVIILIVTVILFFRKSATRRALQQDKRALLLLVTLGAIFITSLLVGVKLSQWKDDYRHAKIEYELKKELDLNEYRFIEQTFKPLGKEYRKLYASRDGLDKMITKISQLKPRHKNHEALLDTLLKSFQDEKEAQDALYKGVNLEIRNAMLLSATTQDAVSMHNKFYNRAKVLHAKLITSHENVQKKLGRAAHLLVDNLKEARKKLEKAGKYPSRKKNKQKKQVVRLYKFPEDTAQALLRHLEKHDPEMLRETQLIIQEIRTSQQSKDTMYALSQRETELVVPLQKTMKLWADAEIQGQHYWGNILYSLEAAYLADQFNMPHHNRDYRKLMKDLKKFIPLQLNKLVETNKDVKSSFIAPDFVDSK